MNRQEIQELLALLEGAGMKPMLCDCPVQYYDADVQAGIPTEIGDPERGEYLMLPRELVGLRPVFVIHVSGDSMKEADARELRRMEELSFRKSPVLWDEKNAPVTGKRFEDYLRIAQLTMEEVEK